MYHYLPPKIVILSTESVLPILKHFQQHKKGAQLYRITTDVRDITSLYFVCM